MEKTIHLSQLQHCKDDEMNTILQEIQITEIEIWWIHDETKNSATICERQYWRELGKLFVFVYEFIVQQLTQQQQQYYRFLRGEVHSFTLHTFIIQKLSTN